MLQEIRDIAVVLLSRNFADLSLHCHQNLSNLFYAAGSIPWFMLLMSLHLYLRLEAIIPENQTSWFNIIRKLPRKLAYNLVFAQVWLSDCQMLLENGVEVRKETMFDQLVRPRNNQVQLLQEFAQCIQWPLLQFIDKLPLAVTRILHKLNLGRGSWLETWLRGLIMPGQISSFLLLGSLLDLSLSGPRNKAVSIELEKSFRDLQRTAANIGVLFNGASYWHTSCVVGKVLGPHMNTWQVADWICGVEVEGHHRTRDIIRVVQNPTRHILLHCHMDAFSYNSDPAGQPKSSYDTDEFEIPTITFEVDQYVEFISVGFVKLHDYADRSLYNAYTYFIVDGLEVYQSLRYDVSFIEAYHCGIDKHALHKKFPYKCVKARCLPEYRSWGHADIEELYLPGQVDFAISATEVPPERVLVVEAYRPDEEILTRAWCSNLGLSAIVGNITDGNCAACAIRQAFICHVSVVILSIKVSAENEGIYEEQQFEEYQTPQSSSYTCTDFKQDQDSGRIWEIIESTGYSTNTEQWRRSGPYPSFSHLQDHQIDGAGDHRRDSTADEHKLQTGRLSSETAGAYEATSKLGHANREDFATQASLIDYPKRTPTTIKNIGHNFQNEATSDCNDYRSARLFPGVIYEDHNPELSPMNPIPPRAPENSITSSCMVDCEKNNVSPTAVSFSSNGEIIISAAVLGLAKDLILKPEDLDPSDNKDVTISFGVPIFTDSKDKSRYVNRHLTLKFGDLTLEIKGPNDALYPTRGSSHLYQPCVEGCTDDESLPKVSDINTTKENTHQGKKDLLANVNTLQAQESNRKISQLQTTARSATDTCVASKIENPSSLDEKSADKCHRFDSRAEIPKNLASQILPTIGVNTRYPDDHVTDQSRVPLSEIRSTNLNNQSTPASESSTGFINPSQVGSLSEYVSYGNGPIDSLTVHNLSFYNAESTKQSSQNGNTSRRHRTWSLDYLHSMQLREWLEESKNCKITDNESGKQEPRALNNGRSQGLPTSFMTLGSNALVDVDNQHENSAVDDESSAINAPGSIHEQRSYNGRTETSNPEGKRPQTEAETISEQRHDIESETGSSSRHVEFARNVNDPQHSLSGDSRPVKSDRHTSQLEQNEPLPRAASTRETPTPAILHAATSIPFPSIATVISTGASPPNADPTVKTTAEPSDPGASQRDDPKRPSEHKKKRHRSSRRGESEHRHDRDRKRRGENDGSGQRGSDRDANPSYEGARAQSSVGSNWFTNLFSGRSEMLRQRQEREDHEARESRGRRRRHSRR